MHLRAFAVLILSGGLAWAEHGTLIVHFLDLPVGQETYNLTDNVLHASFEYTERGSKIATTATLRMQPDLTPIQFEVHGKSYRPFSVDASITPGPQPGPFFTIRGYSPLSVQMMMLRYWLGHGKPKKLAQLPAGVPDADLTIEDAGHDTVDGVRLERYSIGNVVWGRESVWLNDRGEIAAASTYAGNLPLEAVREEYQSAFASLMKSAVNDRMKELAALSKRIQPLAKGTFIVTNATLIDGTGAAPVPDAAVLVRNGRIISAGAKDQIGVPRGVTVIDGHGGAVLPGLWEMHAHFAQVEYGPAYLAAGVTTARDCGEEFAFITEARDLINKQGALGPRLILAGLVDGSGTGTFGTTWADTPEEGRAVVAKYKAAGFAQMKIYNRIKPGVLRAITAEAHRVGMTVTGHIPEGMTAFEGVEDGMDQINHLGPVTQAVRAKGLEASIKFFKEHHTVIDPTLAWGELLARPKNVEISSFEPGFAKAPYTLTSVIGTAAGQGARLAPSFELVKALYKAGIPIVAGTDKAVPAHSLHRELELYVKAGLTPMEVIQIATRDSARAMGMESEVGTIEAGKRADLILVDGNPLKNFADLRKITRVITGGRVYDPAPLWQSVGFRP